MSAHAINGRLSGREDVPASSPRTTLTSLLREKLRFRGVVISDDMQMAAIEGSTRFDEAVRQAVLAGNDILLFAKASGPHASGQSSRHCLIQEARRYPEMLDRIRQVPRQRHAPQEQDRRMKPDRASSRHTVLNAACLAAAPLARVAAMVAEGVSEGARGGDRRRPGDSCRGSKASISMHRPSLPA